MGTCQCKPEKDVIGVNDVMMRSSIETPGWRDEDSDDEVVCTPMKNQHLLKSNAIVVLCTVFVPKRRRRD